VETEILSGELGITDRNISVVRKTNPFTSENKDQNATAQIEENLTGVVSLFISVSTRTFWDNTLQENTTAFYYIFNSSFAIILPYEI
jgi:hypothetical protein